MRKNIPFFLALFVIVVFLVSWTAASVQAALTFDADSMVADGGVTVQGTGVMIGTQTGAASTTIKAGTGQIVFMGQLASMATSGLVAYPGTATTTAASNDTVGKVTSQAAEHTYTGVGFSTTYGTAPICVAYPANAAAATMGTSTYVGTTATSVTVYHGTSSAALAFTYFCMGAE